jgi:hypothetical protein
VVSASVGRQRPGAALCGVALGAMGWELTIFGDASETPRPLGTRERVRAQLSDRLPGTQLAPVSPAFADHMKAKLQELGLPYTPTLEGCYQARDSTIELYCADVETIPKVSAIVRGSGDPRPALRGLCAGTTWIVVDDTSGKSILERDDRNP